MKYTSSYKKISVPENSFCLIKSLTKVTLTSLQTTAKQSVHFKKTTCDMQLLLSHHEIYVSKYNFRG